MAHITLSQLTTVLQRIVSWATGKFAAKNTYSGKIEYTDMPVVVLASMGSELDGTSAQRPMSAGSTYYLPAGQGAGARIMFVDSNGTAVKISNPESNVIYCNAYTGLLYRWDASESDMVPVGGDVDGLSKVYVDNSDFSSLDTIYSGVYQVIDQTTQRIIGVLVASSDNRFGVSPYFVTQWLFSNLMLSDEYSGSFNGYYTIGRAHIIHRFYNASNTSYSDIPLNTWSEWKVYGITLDEMSEIFNSKVSSISVNGTNHTPDSNGVIDLGTIQGAQGPKGDTGNVQVDGNGNVLIVNNLEEGGTGAALSAEMGKRVAGREATDRQRIDAIVGILKKSVFTDDQTAAFAALDALSNGIDSISFNTSSHKFTGIGDTFTLNIVTDPAGKTAQVTWATSNASVATINNGVVTSVSDGSAVITATTTDGKVAVCNIEVVTVVINGVSLNKSTLTLNGNDANETLIATTNPTGYESGVQWSSSDQTKATVNNNGKVTAVGNGSAIITASIGGHSATCQVTVTGVMQTFHIGVGTLSNVTTEDGQGNAITDGQAVVEGSALTINFVPASSHEISALSVVMGNTSLSLADATDGADGTKVISIQSVSGDITVSASATYVEKDYYNDGVDLNGFGVKFNTSGDFAASSDYKCRVIPLDFGKFYEMDYQWTGTSGGYNIAFVKSDGNGGYTNLINGTDVTPPSNRGVDTMSYRTNVYRMGSKGKVLFSVFNAASYNVDRVYLAVNTKFSSNVGVTSCSIEEFTASPYSSSDFGIKYNTGVLELSNANDPYTSRVFDVGYGKSYSYSGYNRGISGAYNMGLAVIVDGVLRSLRKTEASSIDSFFSNSTYASKENAPSAGSFRVPSREELLINADKVFFVANLKYGTDSVDNSNFIITEAE